MTTKPFRIILDLDFTVLDYEAEMRARLAAKHGVPVNEIAEVTDYALNMNNWPGMETQDQATGVHNEFVREGMFSTMTAYPNAAEAIKAWRAAGARVKIVTTRFWDEDPLNKMQITQETANCLMRNRIEFDEFMITHFKEDIIAELGIDDSPNNIAKFQANGMKVLMPFQNYTKRHGDAEGIPYMKDWIDGKDIVLQMIADHNAVQASLQEKVLVSS